MADLCAGRKAPNQKKSETMFSEQTATTGLSVSINRIIPSQSGQTTRREFISGSSALLAGVTVAGVISQSGCSSDATVQPVSLSNSALVAQPTVTNYQPRCWLEASDLVSGGLADGAQVLQWADRTDNDYDLQFQAKIADINGVWAHSPPLLKLNAVNGLPAVSFAASQSQTMIWTPGGALDQGLTGFSAVFVIRPDTSVIADAAFLFITHTPSQTARIAIVMNPTQGGVRAIIETPGAYYDLPAVDPVPASVPFGALNAPEWGILSFRVWYGLNPNATLKVNSVSSNLAIPGAVTPTTPSYMDVLCSTSEVNHLTCEIAEMSFYPGYLSDSQLSAIETALQQKYALSA
jgi:hypothetical protein